MSDRFLGLTKTQFIGALVTAMILTFALHAYTLYDQAQLAAQGNQSHAALCTFRGDLAKRASDSRTFLALTKQQRIIKYGPALGSIPETTIQQSLRQQMATLASLSQLHC